MASEENDVTFDLFFRRVGDQIRDIVNDYRQRFRYILVNSYPLSLFVDTIVVFVLYSNNGV